VTRDGNDVAFLPPPRVPSGEIPEPHGRVPTGLRRNAALAVAVFVVVTGTVVALSFASPARYEAHARIAAGAAPGDAYDAAGASRGLASSQVLITAPRTLDAAARRLGSESPAALQAAVSAHLEPTTGMVDVIATHADPHQAARIATTVASTYLAARADGERRAALRARAGLESVLADLSRREAAGPLGSELRRRIIEQAAAAGTAGSTLTLADPATVPVSPVAPPLLRNGLLAALAGLLLAGLTIAARERLRHDPAGPRRLAEEAGQPLLAVLPDGRRRTRGTQPSVAVAAATVQESLTEVLPADVPRVVLVCGVAAGQGSAAVADRLSLALYRAGWGATRLTWERGRTAPEDLDNALGDGHDYLILDAPAVGESPDLRLVSRQLDGAVLVARDGRVTATDVAVAADLLRAFEVHVLGLVVTAPAGALARVPSAFEPAAPPPALRPHGAPEHSLPAFPAPPPPAPPPPAPPLPDVPLPGGSSVSLWTRSAARYRTHTQQPAS
jgi:capsular polysaccharide biosynthesis protein